MRWLLIAIAVLILLFWQYQNAISPTKDVTQHSLADFSNEEEVKAKGSEPILEISLPIISSNEDWLQPSLKTLFDHYLLEYEQDTEAMWLAFNEHCSTLNTCDNITELFQRYIDYKKSLARLDSSKHQSIAEINEQLDALADVRKAYFSEQEIVVLFAEESRWQVSALQRQAIRQDESLTEQQKQQLLNLNYQSLEGSEAQAIKPSLQLAKVVSLNNADIEDNYNQLAAEFGTEAADRLVALNEKKKQWNNKIAQFKLESKKLAEQYTGEELEDAINALKNNMFTTNEMKRLADLD